MTNRYNGVDKGVRGGDKGSYCCDKPVQGGVVRWHRAVTDRHRVVRNWNWVPVDWYGVLAD